MTYIALAAIVLIAAYIAWRWFSKRDSKKLRVLAAYGFGAVLYDDEQMSQDQAVMVVNRLRIIRTEVMVELRRIYGKDATCNIDTLTLDTGYYKAAEWTGINARKLTVNPIHPKYKSHFAEEIHNCYRLEKFGPDHIYKPIHEADAFLREEAQAFCRGY